MQQYQSHVAALVVETERELRQRLRSVGDLDGIEAAARSVADGVARQLVEDLLADADRVVAEGLPRGWRLVGFRTRSLLSTVGPLRLTRRLYRDAKGRARLPLDEELGLAPQVRATARLQEIAVELCSRVPFRVAAGLLRQVLPRRQVRSRCTGWWPRWATVDSARRTACGSRCLSRGNRAAASVA